MKLVNQLLAASATLFTLSDAKFWGERVQNLQYRHANHIRAAEAVNGTTTDVTGFRYLNSNTSAYRVPSLPDVNYPLGEFYAGNVPIDKSDPSRTLFFAFYPKIGAPVDEITIWLNGGPGCSSMEGFFQENGPFTWQPGTYLPLPNDYSWVNLTNMVWVDQPVGTGYTTGKATATSEEDIAKDFVKFFKNFQDIFGIKKYKIYVTGESYAGRYVPYISAAFLNQKDTTYYDLKGALVYDPCIGQYDYVQQEAPAFDFVKANPTLFNFNSTYMQYLNDKNQKCGFEPFIQKYMKFPPAGVQPTIPASNPSADCDIFDDILGAALDINPCFNLYDINQACPLQWDVLGFPGTLEYLPPGASIYFDRADVKKAMHAPLAQTWAECKGPVFVGNSKASPEGNGDTSADPIQHVLPQVIEATNRVLVSNGDFDMIILTNGTLLSIQNMTWNGKLGFEARPATPINIQLPELQYAATFADNGLTPGDPQGIMGVQHFERGLMWAETYQSGHMQPQYQPRVAYRHMQWLLGHVQTL